MLDRIQSFYGFTRMPFGRDLACGMLHRHTNHAQATARITYGIDTRGITVGARGYLKLLSGCRSCPAWAFGRLGSA